MALRPAVFIDKDGTLVHDLPYNVDAARIRLRHQAGRALARLQAAGYALVLVSNQPGVAHGMFAESALDAVWAGIARRLAPDGVTFDGYYYCPHHPEGEDPRYGFACNCRKPRPGMLLRAAAEHGLELRCSWLIGDILDDIEAGRRCGCRTVLLDVGTETEWRPGPWRSPHFTATTLADAADHILGHPQPSWMPSELKELA